MAEQERHLSPMGADAEGGSSADWGQPLQQDEYDPQQPLLHPSQSFAAPALPRMPPSFDAVSHFLSMGLSPNEIIQQGLLDVQTVVTTCQVMGVPMAGYAGASTAAGPGQQQLYTGPPPTMGIAAGPGKAKRKRKRGASKAAVVKGQVQQKGEATAEGGDATEAEMAELLRQKVELERERAILLRAEKKKKEEGGAEAVTVDGSTTPANPTALSAPATAAPDSMQAMRDAALASMKRKRTSVEPSTKNDGESQPASSDATAQDAPPPTVAPPRGPRLDSSAPTSSSGYRDIDAPQGDLAQREREAADALLNAYDAEDDFASQRSMAGATSARQARRPLSYMDDVFRFEANAPAGQVDYTAPLPSLMLAPASRLGSMEATTAPTTPVMTAAGARRTRAPFLGTASAEWQRVVVEYSDDEESSEEAESTEEGDIQRGRRRARTEQTRFILQAWKKERGLVTAKERPRSPATPHGESAGRASIEANALLLQSKEREIEVLKEQMRMLEQKKRAGKATPPADPQSKGSSIPSYQSPFARFPSLRQVVDEQQQE